MLIHLDLAMRFCGVNTFRGEKFQLITTRTKRVWRLGGVYAEDMEMISILSTGRPCRWGVRGSDLDGGGRDASW